MTAAGVTSDRVSPLRTEAGVSPATRWRVLLGAIIVQLILGTVYGYSIFWEPLTGEIFPAIITESQRVQLVAEGVAVERMTVVADETARTAQLTRQQGYLKYAFSICILSFAAVMVIAGRIQDLYGPRIPAMVGGVLMGVGFVLAGLMESALVLYLAHAAVTGLIAVVLLLLTHALLGQVDPVRAPIVQYIPLGIVVFAAVAGVLLGNQYVGNLGEIDKLLLLWGTVGFVAGAGIGFAYVCPIAALVKWFPKQKGLVSGVAVAGFGLGALVFSRPDLPFSASRFVSRHGVLNLFIVHGLICVVVVSLGALMLRNPPNVAAKTALADSTWQATLRRPAFYVLWLMFFSGALAGLMVIGVAKPFVTEQVGKAGMSITEAAAIGASAVGVLSIFNALGRVIWGLVSDRVGRTPAFAMMFLLQAGAMALLGRFDSQMALYVGTAIVGFNFGGNFALFPSATADMFGASNLGANYAWVFTSYGIAGVVGIYAGNTAKTLTGSYSAAFTAAAALCVISAALAVGLGLQRRRGAIQV